MVEDTDLKAKFTDKIQNMDVDIEEMHKEMDGLENISYQRLTELREKNDKLNILERHIDNLTSENEEISKKIVQREFNLLEQDSIIISYEKNLKEKEELLKKKDTQLEEAKIKSEELN